MARWKSASANPRAHGEREPLGPHGVVKSLEHVRPRIRRDVFQPAIDAEAAPREVRVDERRVAQGDELVAHGAVRADGRSGLHGAEEALDHRAADAVEQRGEALSFALRAHLSCEVRVGRRLDGQGAHAAHVGESHHELCHGRAWRRETDPITVPHVRHRKQSPSGDRVQRELGGVVVGHGLRDAEGALDGDGDTLGPCARPPKSDALSDAGSDPESATHDPAHARQPGDLRQDWPHAVASADECQVGRVNRTGRDLHDDLTCSRRGLFDVAKREHLARISSVFEDDRLHDGSS
jgi:hypothetical protein